MPHVDIYDEVEQMKGSELTDADRAEIELRIEYAKRWLEQYADEQFIYTLRTDIPDLTKAFTPNQTAALSILADRIEASDEVDGAVLHALIHEVKESSGLSPKEFFTAIYVAFLGKESGPKVGWFLSTLEQDFVVTRLRLER